MKADLKCFFKRRIVLFTAFMLCLTVFFPSIVSGQGFLIEPVRPRPLPRWIVRPVPIEESTPYKIESLEVAATLSDSVAKVDVSQTFKNEGSSTIETAFVFPLPYDGAIDSMTLLVNGKEYPAKLLDAKEARQTYESIVRKNRDPALMEWVGTGMFKTSVFPIPAGESRTVTLSYSQLMRVNDGLTEFYFPLSCAQYSSKPVGKTSFDLTIVGDTELKNVYSPTLDVNIERIGKNSAKIKYSLQDKVPTNDMRLFFDQSSDELAAKIQSYRPNESEDGYFLLLASPKIEDEDSAPIPKTIVFALDVSGSMSGKKIEQARESLKFVVERLRDGDKFNIVLFNSEVTVYKPELQVSSAETRAEAALFVNSVRARGGTNIIDAITSSFAQIGKDDSTNPKYLVFLSDGEPTTKETNEMKLAQVAREDNKNRARFFTLGVGYDVNSRLLDRFIRDGRGQGVYVKPNENIEDSVSRLYGQIDAPVFSEVSFEFLKKDKPDQKYFTNLVYPSGPIDIFAGEQIVLTGRYSAPGDVAIKATGKIGDKDVNFDFEGSLITHSEDSSYAYIERLWAGRRIGEIIDELDLNGVNKELMDELLQLAKKHGILTPYTSFLADDSVALNDASNAGFAASNFQALASQSSNASGFGQRGLKQSYRKINSIDSLSSDSVQEDMELAAAASNSSGSVSAMGAPGVAMGGGMGGGGMTRARSTASVGPMARGGFIASNIAGSAPAPMGMAPSNSTQNMKNIADKTFYLKEGRWVDSSIDAETEKSAKPIQVVQFSDEYFNLVATNGQRFSQYLVFKEPVILEFNGKLYLIEAAK